MRNSLTYLTRRCPRQCNYCALRDCEIVGKELNVSQWCAAFDILRYLQIDFNLVLGNETWLLGEDLLELFKFNEVPYALYTTCPEPLFSTHRDKLLGSGIIDNLSCGIDYPPSEMSEHIQKDDSYKKSRDAWEGFMWLKEHFPEMDSQGTVTVHKQNLPYLQELITRLSNIGVFIGVNFIHWNKDGKYDFFPRKEEIQDLLFTKKDFKNVQTVLNSILDNPGLLQNPEMLRLSAKQLTQMEWHCEGDPYGGPTIDSDGTLRLCGYRRGTRTPEFKIFDLPDKFCDWQEAVFQDARECPGCMWSYPWMFHYWEDRNEKTGKEVFTKHAGEHIPKSKWSKRINE